MILRRIVIVLIAVVLTGFGLTACGGGDDSVDASDPLVQAIAEDVLADEEEDADDGLFGGDRAKADCFGVELVSSVGKDRLNELGFTVDSIPDEFVADWSANEVDSVIDGLDKCVDHRAFLRTTMLGDQSEEDADCIIGEVGEDWFLDLIRAQFGAGSDQAAMETASDAEFQRVVDAAETCGVSGFN